VVLDLDDDAGTAGDNLLGVLCFDFGFVLGAVRGADQFEVADCIKIVEPVQASDKGERLAVFFGGVENGFNAGVRAPDNDNESGVAFDDQGLFDIFQFTGGIKAVMQFLGGVDGDHVVDVGHFLEGFWDIHRDVFVGTEKGGESAGMIPVIMGDKHFIDVGRVNMHDVHVLHENVAFGAGVEQDGSFVIFDYTGESPIAGKPLLRGFVIIHDRDLHRSSTLAG